MQERIISSGSRSFQGNFLKTDLSMTIIRAVLCRGGRCKLLVTDEGRPGSIQRRTESPFSQLETDYTKFVIPPENTLSFERLTISKERAQKILDGVFEDCGFKDGIYSVFSQDGFIGVGESINGVLRIKSYVRQNV